MREKSGGSIYLPFGSEYSILLKNKDARKVSVGIEVDGCDVLNGNKLIMHGNETQDIKGFMRSMSNTNRFRFIKKNREIQKHRGDRIDDGLIRITYQFEKQYEEPITITWTYPTYPSYPKYGCSGDLYYSDNSFSSASNKLIGSRACKSSGTTSCCFVDNSPRADEGITVKGKDIGQQYVYGTIGSLEHEVHTIVLHLMGTNRSNKTITRPITIKTKFKCVTCGRKNKSSNKYCYNCGTYLE